MTVNNNKTLLYGSPLDNFSPRIGLAWQARDKLVIRAGYGMFFDRVYGNLVGDNILGNEPPYATGIGTNPNETLQNPFMRPGFPWVHSADLERSGIYSWVWRDHHNRRQRRQCVGAYHLGRLPDDGHPQGAAI